MVVCKTGRDLPVCNEIFYISEGLWLQKQLLVFGVGMLCCSNFGMRTFPFLQLPWARQLQKDVLW